MRRSRFEEAGLLMSIVGTSILLFGATTVFAQMQASLNHCWGVVARPSRSGLVVFLTIRVLSLGVVLVLGFLLLISLAISMSIVAIIRFAEHWILIPAIAVAAVDAAVSLGWRRFSSPRSSRCCSTCGCAGVTCGRGLRHRPPVSWRASI